MGLYFYGYGVKVVRIIWMVNCLFWRMSFLFWSFMIRKKMVIIVLVKRVVRIIILWRLMGILVFLFIL